MRHRFEILGNSNVDFDIRRAAAYRIFDIQWTAVRNETIDPTQRPFGIFVI